jgi:hypothetical protein
MHNIRFADACFCGYWVNSTQVVRIDGDVLCKRYFPNQQQTGTDLRMSPTMARKLHAWVRDELVKLEGKRHVYGEYCHLCMRSGAG